MIVRHKALRLIGRRHIPLLFAFADIAIRAFIAERLTAHNARAGGSSGKVRRLLLMTEPPSVDGHEITDKGYINQRATLDRRAALVCALYTDPMPAGVLGDFQ